MTHCNFPPSNDITRQPTKPKKFSNKCNKNATQIHLTKNKSN